MLRFYGCQATVHATAAAPPRRAAARARLPPHLMRTKAGRIVTKKAHTAGLKAYTNIKGWATAVQKARKALGITGWQAVKKVTPLYSKAKEIARMAKRGWIYDCEKGIYLTDAGMGTY